MLCLAHGGADGSQARKRLIAGSVGNQAFP